MNLLISLIKKYGIRHPKKHGEWYLLKVHDNHTLVYDTWNYTVYHYPNGAIPHDTDNLYQVVYVFYNKDGDAHDYKRVLKNTKGYWEGMISIHCKNQQP